MTIEGLIDLARRRLVYLSQTRAAAESIGDVVAVGQLDQDIAETETTLAQLMTLLP